MDDKSLVTAVSPPKIAPNAGAHTHKFEGPGICPYPSGHLGNFIPCLPFLTSWWVFLQKNYKINKIHIHYQPGIENINDVLFFSIMGWWKRLISVLAYKSKIMQDNNTHRALNKVLGRPAFNIFTLYYLYLRFPGNANSWRAAAVFPTAPSTMLIP